MTDPLPVPTVSPRPGGHEFYWGPEDCYIRIERVREHHDAITAEVWVEQGPKRGHLIGGIRFTLTTGLGRTGLAKSLLTRCNGVDWGGMIEQVCIYTLQKFREQEATTSIGNLPLEKELPFTLSPVLPKGLTTILYGYGGMAKSTIAIAWGLLVQLGEARLGLRPIQSPVLLLDWENNAAIANRLQLQLHAGMDLPGEPHFRYRRCRRPLIEFTEEVKAEVEREAIGLVIVDSLAKACGSEKVAREEAIPTMDALGSLKTTCLAIAHRPKGEEGRLRGIYGSVAFENDARQAFRVEAAPDPEGKTLSVALFNTKHNLTKELPPIGYSITWAELQGTNIQLQEVGSMTNIREQLPTFFLIKALLLGSNAGKLTVEEIAKEGNIPKGTVYQTLKRHQGKYFVCLGGTPALWGLLTTQTPDQFR